MRGILYLAVIKSNIPRQILPKKKKKNMPRQKKMEYIFRYRVIDFRVHIVGGEIGKIEKK